MHGKCLACVDSLTMSGIQKTNWSACSAEQELSRRRVATGQLTPPFAIHLGKQCVCLDRSRLDNKLWGI